MKNFHNFRWRGFEKKEIEMNFMSCTLDDILHLFSQALVISHPSTQFYRGEDDTFLHRFRSLRFQVKVQVFSPCMTLIFFPKNGFVVTVSIWFGISKSNLYFQQVNLGNSNKQQTVKPTKSGVGCEYSSKYVALQCI